MRLLLCARHRPRSWVNTGEKSSLCHLGVPRAVEEMESKRVMNIEWDKHLEGEIEVIGKPEKAPKPDTGGSESASWRKRCLN